MTEAIAEALESSDAVITTGDDGAAGLVTEPAIAGAGFEPATFGL